MHLILGACCEKLPRGIFLSCSSRGSRINHLNSNPLKILLPPPRVSTCVRASAHGNNEQCATNVHAKLQKSLGLISQPFRGLSVNSPVLLACLILGEHKEKCKCLQDLCLSHNAETPTFNPVLQRKTSLPHLLTLQVG